MQLSVGMFMNVSVQIFRPYNPNRYTWPCCSSPLQKVTCQVYATLNFTLGYVLDESLFTRYQKHKVMNNCTVQNLYPVHYNVQCTLYTVQGINAEIVGGG